ncbi:MAG: penicillin-binding protein 1C [Rhodobacterales bacterium]|nr:MAG: penicillin-binding protein 1C [Rhodobacterales bacterium]
MKRIALILAAALLFSAGLARDAFDAWVARTELPVLAIETSVEMRDRHGALMRVYTVADGRWRMTPGAVDPKFIDMLIAFEDKRFFTHPGVDPVAILRAAGQAAWNGRVVSGGSTLTMQVARLLENSGTGRWRGKLRQIRVALALERQLSKAQILELYLTHAPYGGNIEGLRAATLAYFGKEPQRLTPSQAALLVALPQAPERRRPDRNPTAARAARDRVLHRMQRFDVLSDEATVAALETAVPTSRRPFPALSPHLTDRLRARHPLKTEHRLTLDANVQARLEDLARTSLRNHAEQLSVALVIAELETGDILGAVGSASYGTASARQGFVDMTRALRSPGSTLKPLVYGMAFDLGLAHPETVIHDRPVAFGPYTPQNFDGAFRGELRVAEALRLSLNIPVVLLTEEIGPGRLINRMKRAGMSPALPGHGKPGLAVALGGVGVTLEDLVTLYAGIGRGGEAVRLREQPDQPVRTGPRVLSRAAAWHVGHILSGLTPPGGAGKGRLAFKTGTSYGHRDAWAVGFDGSHVAGVWIGRPDGTPVPGAFGGDMAAPILAKVFQRTKPAFDPLFPPPPETVMVATADLPQPLRKFRGRNAVFQAAEDAPVLAFPPDGARLARAPDLPLTLKIREGEAPFTVLANGEPIVTGARSREIALPGVAPGFVQLSIIDARGRSARAQIRLE